VTDPSDHVSFSLPYPGAETICGAFSALAGLMHRALLANTRERYFSSGRGERGMARCGGEPLAAIARQTSVVHHEATSRATAWREPCPLHGTPLRRRDARERCSHEINQRCRSSFHPLTIEPPPPPPPRPPPLDSATRSTAIDHADIARVVSTAPTTPESGPYRAQRLPTLHFCGPIGSPRARTTLGDGDTQMAR
jgi:hypothetical protein